MEKNNLFKKIKSLDSHLNEFKEVSKVENPKEGWINKIRTSLNITSKRLGENFRKPISAQAIIEFEKSEMKGNISLESMKKFAEALNLEFVYGFAPKKDTFEMRIKTEFKHKIEEHRKFVPIDDLNYDKGTQLKAVMENEYQREIDSLPKSFWNSKLTYNNMMNRYTFSPISEKDGIGEMKITDSLEKNSYFVTLNNELKNMKIFMINQEESYTEIPFENYNQALKLLYEKIDGIIEKIKSQSIENINKLNFDANL